MTAWFGAITLAASGAVHALVRAGCSAAGVWAANAAAVAGMAAVLWWYMLRKFRRLPPTERHSLIIAAGAYRRVLEECETIGDAVKLLDGIERASVTSLVVADSSGGAVIEVTPDTIAVWRFKDKPGVCTNHFCTLKNPKQTDMFDTLKRLDALTRSVATGEHFGIADLQGHLHAASMKDLTIQTFVFEPKAKKVHVRFGDGKEPATKGKLVTLDPDTLWAPIVTPEGPSGDSSWPTTAYEGWCVPERGSRVGLLGRLRSWGRTVRVR